jgi:hypothetical protein
MVYVLHKDSASVAGIYYEIRKARFRYENIEENAPVNVQSYTMFLALYQGIGKLMLFGRHLAMKIRR